MNDDYIFYKGEPHVFSNFHPAPITLYDKIWPTSEHYFQAMKFSTMDEDHVERIRLASTPGKAYKLGWEKKIRSDWDDVRNGFMKRALLAKFSQNEELGKELIITGDKNIIQRCGRDKYWGDGYPGKGENMLGKLLMEVRDYLITKIRKESRQKEKEYDEWKEWMMANECKILKVIFEHLHRKKTS